MARKKQAIADVWIELQRERALTLVNERIERLRARFDDPPLLDGYTDKLGGTAKIPGFAGLWLEDFLKSAVAWRIIGKGELPTG